MEVKPGYKHSDVGVIPDDWEVRNLGSLGRVIRGASPRPKGDRRFYGGNIPRLMVEDVTRDGKHVTPQVDFLTEEGAKRSRPCPKGTLTVVCSGTVGIPSFLSVDACIHDGFLALIHLNHSIDPDYLFHQLTSFQQKFDSLATHGGVFTNLTTTGFSDFKVPVASIPEQKAIASALSDVDALLAALEKMIAKKRDLKQGAMQQLLTGKTRLPGFSDKWQLKRLSDVVDTDPENLSTNTAADFAFNYISLEDVDCGQLRGYSEQIFADAPSRARRKLKPNDVLVSTVRPNLQSHLLFKGYAGCWICSTGFCVIRCNEGVTCSSFIFNHFFASDINRQIDTLLTGSNYPAINSSDVRNLEILFPSFTEQVAIAAVLSDMDVELAALEARRDKTRNIKQGMMQELLTGRIRLV